MRAIVSGTGDLGILKMEYVPTSADLVVGDRVYSSGLGEHFLQVIWWVQCLKFSRHNSVSLLKLMLLQQVNSRVDIMLSCYFLTL
jgi:rod shape-determining protein MreC